MEQQAAKLRADLAKSRGQVIEVESDDDEDEDDDIVAKKTTSVKSVKGNSSEAKKKGCKGEGSITTKGNAKGNAGKDSDAPSTEEQDGKFLRMYHISVSCVIM